MLLTRTRRHHTTPNPTSATITALFLFILGKEGKGKRYDTTAAASKSIELQFQESLLPCLILFFFSSSETTISHYQTMGEPPCLHLSARLASSN